MSARITRPAMRPFAASCLLAVLAAACADQPTGPADPAVLPEGSSAGAPAAGVVVMSNLDSPRGMAWGPDGALYVVEGGAASATGPCATVLRGQYCYSGTAAISRLRKGRQERIVSGLPSGYNPALNDIIGAQDIGINGLGNMYVTIGWGGPPDARAQLGALGSHVGVLLQVRPNGSWRVIADVAALENQNPDGGVVDSNPYGLLAEPSRTFIVDAGGNSLVEVRANGSAAVLATFPTTAVPPGFPPQFVTAEAVPTEVTRGPDGALYVSLLTGAPFVPGAARIFRVVPGEQPTVFAEGFTMITDMDWGRDGSMYVLQYASAPFFGGVGSVIRVAPDGTRTTIATDLTNPTSILAAPDGSIYVANRGNVASVGEVLRFVP
jgi:hypothetical protein